MSYEYSALDRLNSSEGNDSEAQAKPKPVSTDTSLQAQYDTLLKKYNDLKSFWDMYGGDEGITWAYKKADILDKVAGKISEALAMLPPEIERGDKE